MVAEKILLSYKNKIKIHCIRPATVCGISPRMRFDVSVNMLTLQALKLNKIKVLGGNQIRPNIHINDLIRVYDFFLNNQNIDSGSYNAGFENLSIMKLAKIISKKTGANIQVFKSNDPRSYRQDSSKLISLGFNKKFSVHNAIDEIIFNFKNGYLYEDDSCYTVKWMKKKKIT
jgi:nucleoside-diphosphate-sugar epimerase